MKMLKNGNFNKKIILLVIISLFFCSTIFSQDLIFNQTELQGEWQNSKKYIHFDFENKKIIHELKTFYGLWRDKPFDTDLSSLQIDPLVFQNQLFIEYWVLDSFFDNENKSKLKLYLPASNIKDISLDNPKIQNEVYAYLILDENYAIKIRYWLVDLELESEDFENQRGMITENTVDLSSSVVLSNLQDEYYRNIKKNIKIGDKTYTCVEGRGVKIRNVKKINLTQEFKQYKFIEKGNKSYLVLQNPYMIQTID